MSCLACGAETALDAILSPHDLAEYLCLDHMLEALEGPAQAPPPWRPRGVKDRRCQGLAGTCPRAVTKAYLNASWCSECAPPDGPEPEPAHIPGGSDNTADDGMAEALLVVLDVFGATILETWPHAYGAPDELEGSP